MFFERQYGSKETRFNSAVTAGTAALAITCPAGSRLIIRRVRGACSADITLKQGTSVGGAAAIDTPVIQSGDNFDIPGMLINLTPGNNLYIDVASNATPDIAIHYGTTITHE